MSVWVIIPVKPIARAKSRLASVISPAQREHLAETIYRNTLKVVRELPQVTGTLVISRDGHVLSIAREMGVHTVQESGAPELNNALMRATQVLSSWRAGSVLILPADIPLVNVEDLSNMITLGQPSNTVVIATDHEQNGTNVLLVRPPGLFPYRYGENSYERHVQLAKRVGAEVKYYESERLQLDIDVPTDLDLYQHYVKEQMYGAVPLLIPDNAT